MTQSRPRFPEFVALMATLMSLVALSIDAMLPALGEIGHDLGVKQENHVQLVVSLFFLGIAVGQVAWGPMSDSFGRKPALLAGLGMYMVGALASALAPTLPIMLAGRVLQGFGVAGPRVVAMAIIRDQYEGRRMARLMSFVMTVFIVVPIIAPALGQGILMVASWRAIFGVFLVVAVLVALWFALRQPETLASDHRAPFTLIRVARGVGEVLRTKSAFGYTLAAGLVFGAFVGYLSTAQQVFQEQYGLGSRFPLVFALLSVAIGSASLTNARLVMRFGMKPLTYWALSAMALLSVGYYVVAHLAGGQPSLASLIAYLLLAFFCEGILYGNMNSLAMEELGHIAGVGAAVVGSLSLLLSIIGGSMLGQSYNGTVLPLVAGFGLLSIAALLAMLWVDFSRSKASPEPEASEA